MSRTAITLAKTHEGKWELLAGPDVPIMEQISNRRDFLATKSHDDYALIHYQESDGQLQVIRLRSPAQQKTHDELRAKEDLAAKEAGEKYNQTLADSVKKSEEDRIKGHREEIAALDKVTLANPNRTGKTQKK